MVPSVSKGFLALVTSRDVAAKAGVSQATVSRVINGRPNVSDDVRHKVEQAMRDLHYVPNASAKAMKTRHVWTIGVDIAGINNPFYADLLAGITRQLDYRGYRTVVWDGMKRTSDDALLAIEQEVVDGLIIATATESSKEAIARTASLKPVVLVNRYVEIDCDRVASSNYLGGAKVADFLLQHGRVECAFLGGTMAISTVRDRFQGFNDKLSEGGIQLTPDRIIPTDLSHDSAFEAVLRVLGKDPYISAFFCANDVSAFGALSALEHLGVPRTDCWIIGFDDVASAEWRVLDLTTVSQDVTRMASTAVDVLLRRIASPNKKRETKELPVELVVRGTTPMPQARLR